MERPPAFSYQQRPVVHFPQNRDIQIEDVTNRGVMPSFANIIGNTCIAGPDVGNPAGIQIKNKSASTRAYTNDNNSAKTFLSRAGGIVTDKPVFTPSGIATVSSSQSYTLVLASAGAMIPTRDPIDARVVGGVQTRVSFRQECAN